MLKETVSLTMTAITMSVAKVITSVGHLMNVTFQEMSVNPKKIAMKRIAVLLEDVPQNMSAKTIAKQMSIVHTMIVAKRTIGVGLLMNVKLPEMNVNPMKIAPLTANVASMADVPQITSAKIGVSLMKNAPIAA